MVVGNEEKVDVAPNNVDESVLLFPNGDDDDAVVDDTYRELFVAVPLPNGDCEAPVPLPNGAPVF